MRITDDEWKLLEWNGYLNQDFVPNKQNNMSNFHPLEVVGRGSGTQFQEGENLN